MRSRPLRLSVLLLAGLPWIPARAVEPTPADRAAKENELRGVETNLKASEDQRRRIETDVEAIKLDRIRLNEALLETTARLQKTEADRAEAVTRLADAGKRTTALEASFGERRERLGGLMAALQRMTRDAPPAILVRPDDMAEAARAAGIVAALVGDAKRKADALASDLAEVAQLKRAIVDERERLAASAADLAVDRVRLETLVAARQKTLESREGVLESERKHADELAGQAANLKDLIARMNGEADRAALADRAVAAAVGSRATKPGGDLARLAPASPFSELKGRLPWPAAGAPIKNFGDPDGFGGALKGVSLTAPPGATVAAPADSWVAFAGSYRSYGQLLILNAGEGYYLVLAGMERIQVSVGQFVLAGEPVAVMGSGGARAASSAAIGAEGPVLYIEFRKNDTTIDPQPWWAKSNLEKARG